jgi:hypothetical protein
MKNNAQLVRMPGTHGSGGDLPEVIAQHTTLRDFNSSILTTNADDPWYQKKAEQVRGPPWPTLI